MGMDPNTGNYVPLPDSYTGADLERAAARLGVPASAMVVTRATPEAQELLAARARAGHAEAERRKARRKSQRAARRRNR